MHIHRIELLDHSNGDAFLRYFHTPQSEVHRIIQFFNNKFLRQWFAGQGQLYIVALQNNMVTWNYSYKRLEKNGWPEHDNHFVDFNSYAGGSKTRLTASRKKQHRHVKLACPTCVPCWAKIYTGHGVEMIE